MAEIELEDKMGVRYTVPVTVTVGRGYAMSQCKCGAVFKAAGFPDEIDAAQKKWDAEHVCEARPALKTFWLSFCDATRPTGSQFLGACIIDVTAADAEDAMIDVAIRFPLAQEGAEWLAAASRNAHRLGCNPGGEMAAADVSDGPPEILALYPRGVLMDKAALEAIAPIMSMIDGEAL